MIYEDAGDRPGEAVQARARKMDLLLAKAVAEQAGVKIEEPVGRKVLRTEFERFLTSTRARGSLVAAKAYEASVSEYLALSGCIYVDQLSSDHMDRFQVALRDRGMSDRTIHNRHSNARAFLKFCGLDVKKLAGDKRPRFEKAMPEVYTPEEMAELFKAVTDPRLALTFEIMLKCGLREQEAMYLEWKNIDMRKRVIRIKKNEEFGFKVKDHEEREVPIEGHLLQRLREYRKAHPEYKLVTAYDGETPDGHLLRQLKAVVSQAAIGCGTCEGCRRKSLPECEHWYLHKFRATYTTMLLRAGIDLRTVMKFTGHSDLASVMRYLRPAEDEHVQKRVDGIVWQVGQRAK